MKSLRGLLVFIAMIMAGVLDAQPYMVLSKKGDCFLLRDSEWKTLQVGMELSSATILRSYGDPAAEVQVYDKTSKACYRLYLLKKDFKVCDFLNAKTADETPTMLEEYSFFVKEMISVSQGMQTKIIRGNSAATHRAVLAGKDSVNVAYELALNSGGSFNLNDLGSCKSGYPLSIEDHGDHVRVCNWSDCMLYVNVFLLSMDDCGDYQMDVLHPIDESIHMEAHSYRDFPSGVMNKENSDVIVIASESLLDPADVRSEMINSDGTRAEAYDVSRSAVGIAVLSF